jgi:hypothetical protein
MDSVSVRLFEYFFLNYIFNHKNEQDVFTSKNYMLFSFFTRFDVTAFHLYASSGYDQIYVHVE